MFICKHGVETREGTGTYFICDVTQSQCQFVRWCNIENRYKPSPNFHSCLWKNKDSNDKEYSVEEIQIEKIVKPASTIKKEVVSKKLNDGARKVKSSKNTRSVSANTQNNKK